MEIRLDSWTMETTTTKLVYYKKQKKMTMIMMKHINENTTQHNTIDLDELWNLRMKMAKFEI